MLTRAEQADGATRDPVAGRQPVIYFPASAGPVRQAQKKTVDMAALSSTIRNRARVPKRDLGQMFKTRKTRPVLPPSEESFTSNEVARISGVSLRQLQWWDERRVVSPRQ